MNKKTSRILVYVINTIIIILNSLISFIESSSDEATNISKLSEPPAIIRVI